MYTETTQLSTLISPPLDTTMSGASFKQFDRVYSGNYKINFANCLKNFKDNKTINYSNFYLTDDVVLSEVLNNDDTEYKSNVILTKFKYSDEYLNFQIIDPQPYKEANRYREHFDYGVGIFHPDSSDEFFIRFLENNICQIYKKYNNDDYYLSVDSNQVVVFVKKRHLSFDEESINPQDFIYMFSESYNGILLFKKNEYGNFIVIKSNNKLELRENIIDYFNIPFTIDRNIYTYPTINHNTSFITYDNINNINYSKSKYNLKNNHLIHKKVIDDTQTSGIISLKNQLTQFDVFSNSNNLLSSTKEHIFVEDFREYTSIFQDIQEEESDDLKLNYVFYNKPYKFNPGVNHFTSPESLYPYSKLNINDSKFINSGSFSFINPYFSDRINLLSTDNQEVNNGQYLLCTWLSGHPTSTEKLWVDRYYYPDLISKEEALLSTDLYDPTYSTYIEDLVTSNTDIKSKLSNIKFFDKRSDFVFEPNTKYEYHRLDVSPEVIIPITLSCELGDYPLNYFQKINERGQFTLSFYFDGKLSTNWEVKSDKNDINHQLLLEKRNNTLYFSYRLFDPSSQSYVLFEYNTTIVQTKYNIVCVSVNSITGIGYLFLNTEVVYNFNITPYKYVKKQLLYGDFNIVSNNVKTNLLVFDDTSVKNIKVAYEFLDPSFLYLLSSLDDQRIESIYPTLPCGMRNSVDDIEIFNDICNSGTFKSNNINIIIKNVGNSELLTNVSEYIDNNIKPILPTNTDIANVIFNKYKNI